MTFGVNVRARREQLGLTQNELARRAGVNQPTLQRIESQPNKDPALSIAVRIARALGDPVEALVDVTDLVTYGLEKPAVSQPAASDERLKRVEDGLRETQERVDLLAQMIGAMADARAQTLEAEVAAETQARKRPA